MKPLPTIDRSATMSVGEVAEIFDVSRQTVYSWAKAGHLTGMKVIGNRWYFTRESVEALHAKFAAAGMVANSVAVAE